MENTKTILLVEDNPDDRLLTIEALRESNVINDIVSVKDGVEALDFLFRRGKFKNRPTESDPAFILLDLKLPKLSGIEVLKEIRNNEDTKFIPVIILTSSSEEIDMINGYKFGTNSYMQKPVGFEEFSKAIRHLGGYWMVLNKYPKEVK